MQMFMVHVPLCLLLPDEYAAFVTQGLTSRNSGSFGIECVFAPQEQQMLLGI